ncbi:TPA: DUF308 domain-containing protein [Klebsiella variicola subsp. variicola]|nr:DUF308 domain-containing protein [Klebsiella variicola subsp. variicola]HCB0645693.1 DUF308 domain-containing protein [Klebsiella variicola subsp. variicola]
MLLIDRQTIGKLNQQALNKYKKSAVTLAILLTLCGILCLLFPIYAGVALSFLTGVLLVVCGIFTLICAYNFRKSGMLAIFCMVIFGIIYTGMGVGIFLSPILGINILSATICFLFLFAGISRISTAFKNPQMIGRMWCLLIGVLDLVIVFFGLELTKIPPIY